MLDFLHNKRLAYIAFVLILGFELTVLVLAFSPNVSDRYKAHFIDKTVKCWTNKLPETMILGAKVAFNKRQLKKNCHYVGPGWGDPARDGLWSDGEKAELFLQTNKSFSAPLFVELVAWAYAPKAIVRDVEVRINDQRASRLKLIHTRGKSHYIRIPDRLLKTEDVIKISFMIKGPIKVKGKYRLGMGLEYIKLVDKPFIKNR